MRRARGEKAMAGWAYAVLYVLLLLYLASCKDVNNFHIRCSVRSLPSNKVYLLHTNIETGEIDTLDQCDVVNGTFSFKGSVQWPKMCSIVSGRWSVPLMVENRDIEVTGNALMPSEDFCIIGSSSHSEWFDLLQKERQWDYRRNNLWINMMRREGASQEESNKFVIQYESYKDSLLKSINEAITKSPASAGVAYYMYYAYVNNLCTIEDLEGLILRMDGDALGATEYYSFLQDEVSLHNSLEANMPAPDFSMPQLNGDVVKMSDYEKKYLYLYFTASWCENCELYVECLRPIYKRYNAKGFEILAVYLDHNRAEIEKYYEKYKYPWNMVCDMKYWESPITKRYGVKSIPYGVLIDDKGIVVVIDPQPDALANYLRKELK